MSDGKLRELERLWRGSGSTEDEAALLHERVRLGQLSRDRLDLAARLGHDTARRVTGYSMAAPEFRQDSLDEEGRYELLEPWLSDLLGGLPAAAARVAWTFAWGQVRVWAGTYPERTAPLEAFQLCEAWLLDPHLVPPTEAFGAARSAWKAVGEVTGGMGASEASISAELAGVALADTALSVIPLRFEDIERFGHVFDCGDAATRIASAVFDARRSALAGGWHSLQRGDPREVIPTDWIVDYVRSALVPWALGHGDPVRDHLISRQAADQQ